MIINQIQDVYIYFYVLINKIAINHKASSLLQDQIKEIFYNLLILNPSNNEFRKIEYKVIKEFKQIKKHNKFINSDQERIFLATKNAQNQIYISQISNSLIKEPNKPLLYQNKIDYIEALKKSDKKEDKKIIKFLQVKDLQLLAKTFDNQMKTNISFRDLARMLVEFNKDFHLILLQEHGSKKDMVGGSDEIFVICEAFFLLQENTKSTEAIKILLKECQEKGYESLIAIINPYLSGESSLKSFGTQI